jgi:hypothetical protein
LEETAAYRVAGLVEDFRCHFIVAVGGTGVLDMADAVGIGDIGLARIDILRLARVDAAVAGLLVSRGDVSLAVVALAHVAQAELAFLFSFGGDDVRLVVVVLVQASVPGLEAREARVSHAGIGAAIAREPLVRKLPSVVRTALAGVSAANIHGMGEVVDVVVEALVLGKRGELGVRVGELTNSVSNATGVEVGNIILLPEARVAGARPVVAGVARVGQAGVDAARAGLVVIRCDELGVAYAGVRPAGVCDWNCDFSIVVTRICIDHPGKNAVIGILIFG